VLTAVAWRSNAQTHYMFDGVVNYSGAVVDWLVNDLAIVQSPAETDALATSANPADRTYLVPAFTGIGAPYWSNRSNAIFTGMTRLTGRAELVRAALESIAYQIADLVVAMSESAEVRVTAMRVSGGPTRNRYLMQFQSDVLDCDVLVPDNREMSAQGAAFMAGIACGVYDASVVLADESGSIYAPTMNAERRQILLGGWKNAVRAAISQ
jgi:glycerol kinase